MKIGIIGLGVVGSAIRTGFEELGHDVFGHDIKNGTKIEDVYPQVEIKYTWDYARKEFSSRRVANVDNFVCFDEEGEQYDYNFYGFDSYNADGSTNNLC